VDVSELTDGEDDNDGVNDVRQVSVAVRSTWLLSWKIWNHVIWSCGVSLLCAINFILLFSGIFILNSNIFCA